MIEQPAQFKDKLSNSVGDEQYYNEEFYFQITKNYPLVWFLVGNKIMYLPSQRSQDTFMETN